MRVNVHNPETDIELKDVDLDRHYVVGQVSSGQLFFVVGAGYQTKKYTVLAVSNYKSGNNYINHRDASDVKEWLRGRYEVHAFLTYGEAFTWLADRAGGTC